MPVSSSSDSYQTLFPKEKRLRDRLKEHVLVLADRIGERNLWHPKQLEAAGSYIQNVLINLGYDVTAQPYQTRGMTVNNFEAQHLGSNRPEEIIVVGAHYDSVIGSPGANDNASGVACILEVARLLADRKLKRTVRWVAFVNEEPPFFQTAEMGSWVCATRSRRLEEKIKAMFSIETIGYYSDDPGSQHYPFPFSFFYPDTGNFIGFVSNVSSRKLLHKVLASFRKYASVPSEGVAAPGWITGLGWSDHWSFWKQEYPAIMVTDTAPFRYQYYHTMEDTPDKIDYSRLAQVVSGFAQVVAEIAEPDKVP